MFRFTIRDVLWLTVVVGVGLGAWLLEHRAASKQIAQAKAREVSATSERGVERFKFLAAFRGWARTIRESVFLDVDEMFFEATPDGEISMHSAKPLNAPAKVQKLRFKQY